MIVKPLQKQTGAVLVFSLLILLVVTLLGVNMVQKNRTQFLMVANAQQQSDAFASAEDVLLLVETYIDTQRYTTFPIVNPNDPYPNAGYTCNKTADDPPKLNQLKPADITNQLGLANAFVASGVVVTITKTSCLTAGIEVECQLNEAGTAWKDDEINCNQITPTFCPTEIYDINVTVTNAEGSRREIESKYAVRCDV